MAQRVQQREIMIVPLKRTASTLAPASFSFRAYASPSSRSESKDHWRPGGRQTATFGSPIAQKPPVSNLPETGGDELIAHVSRA
jgi:hypothetical protein